VVATQQAPFSSPESEIRIPTAPSSPGAVAAPPVPSVDSLLAPGAAPLPLAGQTAQAKPRRRVRTWIYSSYKRATKWLNHVLVSFKPFALLTFSLLGISIGLGLLLGLAYGVIAAGVSGLVIEWTT
jgi:hypothetical protein